MCFYSSSILFIISLNLKYSVTLNQVNFHIIKLIGIRNIIISGYANIKVWINPILNIKNKINANATVFNKLYLYSENSFQSTIVISLSEINIKNIINNESAVFKFIKL